MAILKLPVAEAKELDPELGWELWLAQLRAMKPLTPKQIEILKKLIGENDGM